MKTAACRVSSVECRVSRSFTAGALRHGAPERCEGGSFVIRHFVKAFTLIELLTVIAIIGLLAALLAPTLRHLFKPEASVSATRQMLDDMARARQLAISQRSTVYVVFIPTNFWQYPSTTPWLNLPAQIRTSTIVTQLYNAQWNGYMMVSLRGVGDQPGRTYPKDLMKVKTLPQGAFFAPFKFTSPDYYHYSVNPPYPTNRPDLLMYGFLTNTTIPFPTVDVLTNAGPPNPNYVNTFNVSGGLMLPYIAFNYLGQLTRGDGSLLPYDENIPLDYGSIAEPRNPTNKAPVQGTISVIEEPAGNSTNVSFNVIHIDRLTGRARLERQDVL